jgi:hypothetical protein
MLHTLPILDLCGPGQIVILRVVALHFSLSRTSPFARISFVSVSTFASSAPEYHGVCFDHHLSGEMRNGRRILKPKRCHNPFAVPSWCLREGQNGDAHHQK